MLVFVDTLLEVEADINVIEDKFKMFILEDKHEPNILVVLKSEQRVLIQFILISHIVV